jgi:CheY-like chemotaxis protein
MMSPEPAAAARVLLVDDELDHLRLRAYEMKRCGFTVITAGDAMEAISILKQEPAKKIDIAVIDYHMPVMNGCALADYLRSKDPEMKIILNSGAVDIPQSEMTNVDAFISKGDGMARLLAQVAEFAQPGSGESAPLSAEHELSPRMRNRQC